MLNIFSVGERGVAEGWMGAAFIAFMVARAGEAIVFLQAGSQGNRTRATMKAHPPPHPPPSPLRHLMGFS